MVAAFATHAFAKPAITATEAIERIFEQLTKEGIARRQQTTDTIKIGDPGTPVTGICTTFQATFGLLKRAAAARKNLIVSHESLFWGDGANHAPHLSEDPVYRAKQQFVKENQIVVWRFHDHLHARRPDPIFAGLTRQLGWESYFRPGPPDRSAGYSAYDLPDTTLKAVAQHVRKTLGTQNVRVVGDPNMKVRRVSNSVHWLTACLSGLRTADVVLVGETGELDTMEYVRDSNLLGISKGLIVISHNMLEEWGMRPAAAWLSTVFPDLPVEFMPSREPYWVLADRRQEGPSLHRANLPTR